jgi:hypothetical protein
MKLAIALFITFFAAADLAIAQSPTPSPASSPQAGTAVTDQNQNSGLPAAAPPAGPITPSTAAYVRPDKGARRKRFINSTIGPVALGRMVFNAGVSTWSNSPEEWGTKWEGFGRRFASNIGKNVIRQTTSFTLDEALKYDSYFYRSKNKSVGARLKNALISPVTARDREGKRVLGIPRIAAAYTSSIIAAEAWFPDRYDWKDGLKSGSSSLAFNAAFNLFREFIWKR